MRKKKVIGAIIFGLGGSLIVSATSFKAFLGVVLLIVSFEIWQEIKS
jgi:hypothetical protein